MQVYSNERFIVDLPLLNCILFAFNIRILAVNAIVILEREAAYKIIDRYIHFECRALLNPTIWLRFKVLVGRCFLDI